MGDAVPPDEGFFPPCEPLVPLTAAAAHPGGRVAIVSHGVAILCYVGSLMGLEIPAGLRLMPYYTSVTVVRVNLGLDRRMVGSLVDATHLAGMDD